MGDNLITHAVPANLKDLSACIPVYEEFNGWHENITGALNMNELPENARKYLNRLEELSGAKMILVSVGAGREETIQLENPFQD
jgi:adenylosuccinate synthase